LKNDSGFAVAAGGTEAAMDQAANAQGGMAWEYKEVKQPFGNKETT
jgi:hypothetical protein